ncbi:hypothetical protein EJ08DRAFT_316014 [Tothia fuscella]|uniref:Peptidase S8/S53 domain-containing protein n=1 Tax=Tothia fuscella TaxID=1048955 RepID=A0A9P4NNT8_9PEZI|nr:hypothetical protein EJ08DRAFT_316014 [Tothia fuscella]
MKERALDWYENSYVYDDTAGEDVDVYIIDSGADLKHPEFTQGADIASSARWLYAGLDPDGTTPEDDSEFTAGSQDSGPGHGTCMLGIVGGHWYGVAKKINPILVRIPRPDLKAPVGARYKRYLDAVLRVIDDVGEGKRAILNMSFFIRRRDVITGQLTFSNPDEPQHRCLGRI